MPFSTLIDSADLHSGWRSLTDSLTDEQVRHLTAKERHPAYASRPGFLLLEALDFVKPGCVGDYMVAGLAASP
ncbi:hypothetical protein BH10ACT9_BH10ACT9_40740 [soil metagenome]